MNTTKSIALFNHKGGVSKTTTTFHLGWMLAQKGHRVMIVDTDPQCNLTGVCVSDIEGIYNSGKNPRLHSVGKQSKIPVNESLQGGADERHDGPV